MRGVSPINVLDCTFRDGGYYNEWVFPPDLVNRYLSAMRAAGVDAVEIGFRHPPRDRFLGPFAFSSDRYLAALDLPADFRLAVMSDGKVLLGDGPGRAVVDKLYGPCIDSPVDIVRIAASIGEVPKLGPAVEALAEKGYIVCLNIMQIGNKPFDLIADLARTAASYDGLSVLYFADSFGNMDPDMVRGTVEALRTNWSGPLGIHTHDNMNKALANSLVAIDSGIEWVDGTVMGMGRGAGNVAMEYLLHALQERGLNGYRPDALMPLLLDDFVALRQRFGWGPNFLYYLAARHEIHPTFLQRLQDPGQVDAEALTNALDYLRNAPANAFTEEALDRAMRAESVSVPGTWKPAGWANGSDILLVANGPGSYEHREAIAHFIRNCRPRVVSLNHVESLDAAFVDAYAVCHPSRLIRDLPQYGGLGRPVVLPVDELAKMFASHMDASQVHNFGMTVEPGALSVAETGCTIPTRKVAPYALALAAAAGARHVFLAGFDGFAGSDPRQQEMNRIFDLFRGAFPDIKVTAVTPSRYNVTKSSVYAY